MTKLIIVSHRLPYTCSFDQDEIELKPSVGGLATGLMPLLRQNAVWIGWHGCSQRLTRHQSQQIQERLSTKKCLPLFLPIDKQKIFYNDVANGIIWPLYHYHADHIPLHLTGWEAYEEINRIYADAIAAHAQPGDTVWIHDYHLQVLPQMLRERNLKVKIGFFLHIPFPAFEIFRILPWREEILEGILGADLVGFHTEGYGRYFREAVQEILGLSSEDGAVILDKRKVEIDAFPLGVDFHHWTQHETPEHASLLASALRNLKKEHPFLRLLLSVDRLDYTKGLPRKLLAFERLLEQHEELHGLVSLVQIAPPSRDSVPVYGRYRKQVEELVGRINGRFGMPGYQPVQYIARSFSSDEISLLYPITDVMVVTPLRDGMNLVAKEFIASRSDDDGVLVLSELAGAASELDEALKVNPFDIDKTAAVFFEAVTMEPNERKLRMRSMRNKIESFDTHIWAKTFIDRLEATEDQTPQQHMPWFQSPKDLALQLFESNRKLVIFIDYDLALQTEGHPFNSAPDTSLKLLLNHLARSERCELHVFSAGREESLKEWFPAAPFTLHAELGTWTIDGEQSIAEVSDSESLEHLDRAAVILNDQARRSPGAWVERRAASLILHYRLTDLSQGERLFQRLREQIKQHLPLEIFEFASHRRSFECRLRSAGLSQLLARRASIKQGFEHLILIAGDGRSLNSFVSMPGLDQLIVVGKRERGASWYLRDSDSLREALRYLDLFLSSPGLRHSLEKRTSVQNASGGAPLMPHV